MPGKGAARSAASYPHRETPEALRYEAGYQDRSDDPDAGLGPYETRYPIDMGYAAPSRDSD